MEDRHPQQSNLHHDPPPPPPHPPPVIPNNHHHDHVDPVKEESPRKPVTAGAGGDRLKRDEWSEGAVSTLLEAYETKWVLRNRAKLKGHDWEDVAKYVSSRANCSKSAKTQTQCKNKIESMKKRYRSESASGDASSSWPLYSRLDLLLRGTGPTPSTTTMAVPLAAAPAAAPSQSTHHGNNQGFVLLEPPLAVVQLPHQPQSPPVAAVAPPPLANAQNSHGSNGTDRLAKEDGLGTNKSSDQVSNKNMNAILDTDSSTPALYSHSKEHPTRSNNNNNKKRKMKMDHRNNVKKMKRKSGEGKINEMGIAESIRWLAEVVVRSEQARMEMMKEIEKMRVEAEAKRGEMDLKRTEIIANTQLEIARIFASVNNKGVDSSLRIGRS